MPDYWNDLPPEARDEIERGDAALAALKRGETIERWLDIGRALARMQAEAMRQAYTNIPKGKRYAGAWGAIATHAPHLRDVEQSTRSHAVWLATEWQTVNAWLQTLAHNVRLQLNHPRAIRRRYDAAHVPPGAETGSSPVGGYKTRTAALENENHELRKRLERADAEGSLFNLETDTASEIARVIVATVSAEKARRIAEAMRPLITAKKAKRAHAG
jgi:hypothetical protein